MRFARIPAAALAILVAGPGPALAQSSSWGRSTPAARDEIRAANIAKAMEEHRAALTCTSLNAEYHGYIREGWLKMVRETAAQLMAEGSRPANFDDFLASAAGTTLMPAADTPFADVMAFCRDKQQVLRDFEVFMFTLLPAHLDREPRQ